MTTNLHKIPYIITKGECAKVCRKAKGAYVDGFYSDGKSCEFDIVASIQPLTGREILQVPEGDRLREHFNIFSEFKMQVNDVMIKDSLKYEVQKVEDWNEYTKSIAVLNDGQENE